MGRLQSLVRAAAIACAVVPAAVGVGSEPREPCIPPGTYSPALGGSGPVHGASGETSAAAEEPAPRSAELGAADDAPMVDAVCIPVGTTSPSWPAGEARPRPPSLAVVMTDFRPKDVPLLLDGRLIGPARAFNGNNGFLFLEPGEYRLEARLGGYEPVAFRIVARPDCRFDIRQRMERIDGTAKERPSRAVADEAPLRRVYGPQTVPGGSPPRAPAGPDRTLRPDLSEESGVAPGRDSRQASLRLRVAPAVAAVSMDGRFIATADEFDRLVAPLAVPAGHHVLVVSAPGYESRQVEFSASPGEITELEVALRPQGGE